jgi:hypothetical protein
MIAADDADEDTLPRSRAAVSRAQHAITGQLSARGFKVYEEADITGSVPPDRTRRPMPELIETATSSGTLTADVVLLVQVRASIPAATAVLSQLAWRIRKRSGSAGSRSTTWIGVQAHCQTLMPGMRENWICPRVPSTATRGQDSATRARSAP